MKTLQQIIDEENNKANTSFIGQPTAPTTMTDANQNVMADWQKLLGNSQGSDSWKNKGGSGLGGFGTASNWETGMGAVNALGGLYGLSLQKDALKETQANNAYNRSLGTANYNMKFDAFTPEFLQAQGRAGAIGDWVGTQGGDASKYTSMANLALPTRANLG